jgi:hypothetical protein
MLRVQRTLGEYCLLLVLFLLGSFSATAQEVTNTQTTNKEVASKSQPAAVNSPTKSAAAAPLYKDFKGVTLGMNAEEVRTKLGHLKSKGERQDFFIFSDSHSAQVGYDEQGKATVISVDYLGKENGTPSPESVFGEAVQAKPDGSIYELKRYPTAGYWVAYSRTAGESPIVTVTMKKM